jgi:triacylglycerol lipase
MNPSLTQKLWGWLLDYAYVAYWTVRGLLFRTPPAHFLRPNQVRPGGPVLLIPGVYENWRFMQPVAKQLFAAGHPVHVLAKLGYNTGAIADMAVIASGYLEDLDLNDVVIVAHSKGGLIGKQALLDESTLRRVRRLIAINTPYAGSRYARLFLIRSVRMFAPKGAIITELQRQQVVNARISSLYSIFDPHIPETSRLDGAENIVLPTIGHFRPLGQTETLALITDILRRAT